MVADFRRLFWLVLTTVLPLVLLPERCRGEVPSYAAIREIFNDKKYNVSYEHLIKYYEAEGVDVYKMVRPRLFPLCVNSTSVTAAADADVKKWASIWEAMDKQDEDSSRPLYFYEYEPKLHSMKQNPDSFIERITLSRINTPEVDARNMRQWMHIKVEAKKELEGLYLQTIVGPIGLPTGEFSKEFGCKEDGTTKDEIMKQSKIFLCDYRSRAELHHPNAYFGLPETGKTKSKMFRVHYKWTDISCLETPFLQFIIIAVEKFGTSPKIREDFQPLLSPVFKNVKFDSRDGAITPYYIDWADGMTCSLTQAESSWVKSTKLYHDGDFAALSWEESNVNRVLPNEDLDECVMGRDGYTRNESRRECDPGPFECPETLSLKTVSDKVGFDKIIARRQSELDEMKSMSNCAPCVLPRMDELGLKEEQRNASEAVRKPYLFLDYSEFLNSVVDARYHAALAVFVNMVISPFSILLARYYRGIPVGTMNRNDFWIMMHVFLHMFGLLLYWASIGLVSTGEENLIAHGQQCMKDAEAIAYETQFYDPKWTQANFDESLNNCTYVTKKNMNKKIHTILGTVSFVVHNLNVLFAFFRSRNDYIRNVQVMIHSHLGYLDLMLVVATIVFAVYGAECSEVLGYVAFLAGLTLLMFLVSMCITSSEDRQVGIDPPRYKWPILEPIRLSRAGPMYEAKMTVMGVYAGVLIFVWILNIVAAVRNSIAETQLLSGTDEHKSYFGIFRNCKETDFFVPTLSMDYPDPPSKAK